MSLLCSMKRSFCASGCACASVFHFKSSSIHHRTIRWIYFNGTHRLDVSCAWNVICDTRQFEKCASEPNKVYKIIKPLAHQDIEHFQRSFTQCVDEINQFYRAQIKLCIFFPGIIRTWFSHRIFFPRTFNAKFFNWSKNWIELGFYENRLRLKKQFFLRRIWTFNVYNEQLIE